MTVNLTLPLLESLIEQATRIGDATQRDIVSVLADFLALACPILEGLSPNTLSPEIATLPDDTAIALAGSKMDETQNQRLANLQTRGKQTLLTDAEHLELIALLQIYQIGQLRKSEALAEAVTRGLHSQICRDTLR